MNIYAGIFLIPFSVVIYTAVGGLKVLPQDVLSACSTCTSDLQASVCDTCSVQATFVSSYVHTGDAS